MVSALETLCGQAYGAKQYQKIGVQTYTAIFSDPSLSPSIFDMDLHGKVTKIYMPRPSNFS